MKTLGRAQFNRARHFVETKARPVDRALFGYDFEGGKPEIVWDALHHFANTDGGFGHGMEPDVRLPDSSVLGTITAFPYLLKTKAPAGHPLVRDGIRYLIERFDRKLQGWRMLPPEANHYPRAIWWNVDPVESDKDLIDHWSNPSACVVAYFHHYHELVPQTLLQEVTQKALAVLAEKGATLAGHDYLPYLELAHELPSELRGPVWTILKKQAGAAILTDPSQWTGYGIRPLWAVPDPLSPLMEVLGEAVMAHLDFEIDQQQPDGSWHPFWAWGRFEEEWEKAKLEWQGQLTVKVLQSLKAFGRIM